MQNELTSGPEAEAGGGPDGGGGNGAAGAAGGGGGGGPPPDGAFGFGAIGGRVADGLAGDPFTFQTKPVV